MVSSSSKHSSCSRLQVSQIEDPNWLRLADGGHAEDAQPDGVTEKRFGPSGARTSLGGEPFDHGAAPCAISHRPMAASRSSAYGVSGFQKDLVSSTSTR